MKCHRTILAFKFYGLWSLSLFLVSRILAATVYSDTEFADGNWTTTTISQYPGVITSNVQQLSGGKPGAYRQFTASYPGTQNWANHQSHIYSMAYNPALQGAIASVVFRFDVASFSGNERNNQFNQGFALEQAGNFYGRATAGLTVVNGIWYDLQSVSLTANFFTLVAGNGPLRPDFSESGAPIRFGYNTDFTFYAPNSGSRVGGIDNWSVVVTSVPEPSSLALITIGSLICGFVRHKRSFH